MLSVSIITVVYNNDKYIEHALKSVLGQDYSNIEYIVIDGGSNDGTMEVIEKYREQISVIVSETDEGIYDAINKGISLSTGDCIAILHSDDEFFDSNVVSRMMSCMRDNESDICFSDMVITDQSLRKILRYYRADYFSKWLFRIGWMPPHPTCFIKKSLFDEFGLYSTKYKIAGDFDFLVKIFYRKKNLKWSYLNIISVRMRHGGISNSGYAGKFLINKEINKSLSDNGVWSTPILQIARYPIRLLELLIYLRT